MADFTESEELGNWEDQADSGVLDKRLEEMSIDLKSKEEKQKQVSGIGTGGMLVADDSGRTQYQPQVRILRRDAKGPPSPVQNNSNSSRLAGNSSSSKHGKSLQQREAEYAEARLRIFGSLPPKDDEEEEGDDTGDDSKTENISKQSSPQIIKPDLSFPHMAILRQPKGPDGTSGFKNIAKPDNT